MSYQRLTFVCLRCDKPLADCDGWKWCRACRVAVEREQKRERRLTPEQLERDRARSRARRANATEAQREAARRSNREWRARKKAQS